MKRIHVFIGVTCMILSIFLFFSLESVKKLKKEITIYTDKGNYTLGEEILVKIKNTENKPIYIIGRCGLITLEMKNGSKWEEVPASDDHLFLLSHFGLNFPTLCFPEKNTLREMLNPEEELSIQLTTLNGELFSMKSGLYKIKIEYGTNCTLTRIQKNISLITMGGYIEAPTTKKDNIIQTIVTCEKYNTAYSNTFKIVGEVS